MSTAEGNIVFEDIDSEEANSGLINFQSTHRHIHSKTHRPFAIGCFQETNAWASGVKAQTSGLNFTYDATNWYEAWIFEDGPDSTHGNVSYQNLENAQSMGLTKIIGNQVYMGVDNTTVIPAGYTAVRASIWLESKVPYDHHLLRGVSLLQRLRF